MSVEYFQLLPRLHDLVSRSEEDNSAIEMKLKSISQDLQGMMDQRLKVCISLYLKLIGDL